MADIASRSPAATRQTPSVGAATDISDMKKKAQEDVHSHMNGTQEDEDEVETNGGTQEEEEDEEEGTETIPAGNVDSHGNVVDHAGNVIGHVNPENASQFSGSVVDKDGDILDNEGNVIGRAEGMEGAADELKEVEPTAEGVDVPEGSQVPEGVEKPEGVDVPEGVGAPEGLEKPDGVDVPEGSQDLEGVDVPEGSQVPEGVDVPEGSQVPEGVDVPEGSQVPEGVDAPEGIEKPQLAGPFGVQDNGEITNAVGGVIGKLAEGTPQDLVGTSIKEIDAEGNLKNASGSVIGKAELQPELLDGLEKPQLEGPFAVQENGEITNGTGIVIGKLAEGKPEDLDGKSIKEIDAEGNLKNASGSVIGKAELQLELLEKPQLEGPFAVQENGEITNATGIVIGKLAEGKPEDLDGKSIKEIDAEGNLKNASGSIIGKAELQPELAAGFELPKLDGPFVVQENGEIADNTGKVIGKLASEGKPEDLDGRSIKEIDAEGNLKAASGSVIGKAELTPTVLGKLEDIGEEVPEVPDLSILKGKKVNKLGKIVDEDGTPFGNLVEGEAKKLLGKKCDAEGKIWDDSGKVIGRAELLPEEERELEPAAPFEDFPDSLVDSSGNIIFEGKVVGKLVEGDAKKLEGKKVDADGDVLDKNGNVLGRAERYQEEDEVPEIPEEVDLSILEGMKVNKAGNVVNDNGKLFGRIVTGVLAKLIGKKVDAEGKIWSESGKVIGTAELIPVDDREPSTGAPFEDFPDAIVDRNGFILYEGQKVGKLIEGDAKKLAGKKIDAEGDVVDKVGNVLGKAERWEEPDEPEPEAVDLSALAGKRVNKAGNVVDSHGEIYGRLVEGDPKKLAGKMCDKNGNVWSEGGDIIGRAELVPESQRAGEKEGPFAGFDNPTVTKDGKVSDSKGVVIGRLIEGDAKKLYGKSVDADGDVVDKNGNTLGKAERWEEEEKEEVKSPLAGRKVNREGNVVDENGDIIGKLTDGDLLKCAGKEVDNDGDVFNAKGTIIGHVSLLEDIPEPVVEEEPEEPQETEEEIEKRKQLEQDKKLAGQMAMCITNSLDKIKPILKMITDTIDAAERQPKEELDEQKLVDTVKPLIEEGGQILQEANGVIRGLDPDGRIAANAKHKTAAREATPEEYRLADVLKDLTENVTKTIEQAKKKIAGMPHAEKELNPLWGLLAEPLGQILAAVGLLLAGVLGLVGRLLSGLGLGGLLDNLLGGLGIKGILNGLGLGMVHKSLTGKKK